MTEVPLLPNLGFFRQESTYKCHEPKWLSDPSDRSDLLHSDDSDDDTAELKPTISESKLSELPGRPSPFSPSKE